jgi:hypothetical protein
MQTISNFGRRPKRLPPARVRFWKYRVPSSLKAAFDESLEYAREAYNLSVDRVAELMGLDSKWVLYKWVGENRMPAGLVLPFSHACGIDLVQRYYAAATGKLVIPMPVGRTASAEDINALQSDTTAAIAALLSFYQGELGAAETQTALMSAMQQLGWHSANVAKHDQPELDFDHEH